MTNRPTTPRITGLFLMAACLMGGSARGQGSASTSAQDVKSSGKESVSIESFTSEKPPKAPGEDEADQIVTNKLMRAQTGSLSKWSVKSSWNYSGGSVDDPLAASRPNIRNSSSNGEALSGASATLGLKYRVSTQDALVASFGVNMYTPFNSTINTSNPGLRRAFDQHGRQVDAYNPTVSYMHLYKIGKVQSYFEVDQGAFTQKSFRADGYVSNTAVSNTFAYEAGSSGLTLGTTVAASYSAFDLDRNALNPVTGQRVSQDEYDYAVFPFAEYQLSEHFNLRTLVGFTYEHTRDFSGALAFQRDKVYQSFGLGISVSRDVFLYPNVQFIPDALALSNTNVAMSANLNVF